MKIEYIGKGRYQAVLIVLLLAFICLPGFAAGKDLHKEKDTAYANAKQIGIAAMTQCRKMMDKEKAEAKTGDLMVMTNAGYAEIGGLSTQGALDGVARETGVSRGRNTLVEIHSAPWSPLWFALYDVASGYCAYAEVNPAAVRAQEKTDEEALFKRKAVTRIDAEYVFGHPKEISTKFSDKIFGGNEFRILTIANAVASGAPGDAVRAFEFHDHYCPGITSGIIMARFIKVHFPALGGGFFVQAVSPWCKEDALMVLLNATPGKNAYADTYPTDADLEKRTPEAKGADTIVYRENKKTGRWEGRVLSFKWARTSCPETGNSFVDKLCSDLWYLKNMDTPEDFISVVKAFELPEGVTPKQYARPGVDPLEKLGLTKKN